MGSTNAPVEKMQCLSAPGPVHRISDRMRYAMPARNIHSLGGEISENATTCCQTFSGGALTSMEERTSKVGGGIAAACSIHCTPGTKTNRRGRNAGVL